MWCGLIKLPYSPGAMVAWFLFMSGLYFVQVHSSCMWAVVCVQVQVDVVVGVDVLQLSRVVVVVVVMGCGCCVTVVDALWTPWPCHVVFLLVQLLWLVTWCCHVVAIHLHMRYNGGGRLMMVVGIGGHRQGGEAAEGGCRGRWWWLRKKWWSIVDATKSSVGVS